ncbi:MAG: hypothetical protein JO122_17455, partial [Acetobacteraceae bacterium]|nr:hypothetical protein [Acetobacteraceae bacterium]
MGKMETRFGGRQPNTGYNLRGQSLGSSGVTKKVAAKRRRPREAWDGISRFAWNSVVLETFYANQIATQDAAGTPLYRCSGKNCTYGLKLNNVDQLFYRKKDRPNGTVNFITIDHKKA